MLPFVINYMGEFYNIKKDINYYKRYRYAKKYIISYSADGYIYLIFFSDFLKENSFFVNCDSMYREVIKVE